VGQGKKPLLPLLNVAEGKRVLLPQLNVGEGKNQRGGSWQKHRATTISGSGEPFYHLSPKFTGFARSLLSKLSHIHRSCEKPFSATSPTFTSSARRFFSTLSHIQFGGSFSATLSHIQLWERAG
jgi:hypothetical protein